MDVLCLKKNDNQYWKTMHVTMQKYNQIAKSVNFIDNNNHFSTVATQKHYNYYKMTPTSWNHFYRNNIL